MISFDCQLAFPGFSFDVAFETSDGVTALFGPSGSGKSTAIRLLAGLQRPDSGRIQIDDLTLLDTERGIDVPAHKRRIGLVFQDALLLPHLSVKSNLLYGRWFTPTNLRRIDIKPVIEVLGIGHLLNQRPATLSGGERQRVAIGRALLQSPRLLLLDEPLASLDDERKLEILPFIERLRDEFSIPIVYVSHSVEEVSRLATKVVKLENGHVASIGAPVDTLLAASLADRTNRFNAGSILSARVNRYLPDYGVTILDHPAGEIVVPGRIDANGKDISVNIRATNVALALDHNSHSSVRTVLAGHVGAIEIDEGPFGLVTILLPGGNSLKAFVTRLAIDALGVHAGDEIRALVKSVAIDERGVSGFRPD